MPYQVICCLSFGPASLDRDFLDLLLTKIRLFLYEKKKKAKITCRSIPSQINAAKPERNASRDFGSFWKCNSLVRISIKTFTLKLRSSNEFQK